VAISPWIRSSGGPDPVSLKLRAGMSGACGSFEDAAMI
jgi:hypothetical protein